MKDDFADRMRALESAETSRKFDSNLPIYARIDGRGFSRFAADMEKPFDARMSAAMISATEYLVEKNHARIGYTQSDEINLIFISKDEGAQVVFNGRVQKLIGVLASMATAAFTRAILNTPGFEHYSERLPHFDCRLIQVQSLDEAADMILWREQDARRNAVSMAAQHYFSHSSLQGKSPREMKGMLAEKGIAFEDYPSYFKSGTFMRRVTERRRLTDDERMVIPEPYRPEIDQTFLRSSVKSIAMPRFDLVENRAEVIFDAAEPRLAG